MGVRFIRMPYYIGDLKRDPNLENYAYHHSLIVTIDPTIATMTLLSPTPITK